MEFIRLDEIDSRNFSGVFKNSYFESTAILVFYTILQILGIWGYISGIIPLLALAIICLFCVVLIYKCILDIVKKLKPTNWLIAITDNYIYIKFRSYLYNQFKNDHQVFCLNPPEIQAFRIIQITDVISRGRSKSHCLSTYLDIFVSESLSELSNILKLEYKNIGIKKTSKSKLEISRLDFPVIVLQKNIIRVDISELSPKKELLAAKFKTSGLEELENVEEVVDFTQSKTSKDIIEKRIIEFLKMGRRLDSRDVIMHYYRLDKKQAYNKMEELMRENVL